MQGLAWANRRRSDYHFLAPWRVFPGSGLAPALPTYMLATRTGVRLQPPFRGPGNPSLGIEVNEALPTTDDCRFRDATD
jgi:hypothetical protein